MNSRSGISISERLLLAFDQNELAWSEIYVLHGQAEHDMMCCKKGGNWEMGNKNGNRVVFSKLFIGVCKN